MLHLPVASPCGENNALSSYFSQKENLAKVHNHFARGNLGSIGMKNKHGFN